MKKSAVLFLLVFAIFGHVTLFGQQAEKITSNPVKSEAISVIMERQISSKPVQRIRKLRKQPDRQNLPGNPFAQPFSTFPFNAEEMKAANREINPLSPQVVSTSFDGVTGPTETGAFPPDNMGTAGPTQYVVFVNGRLRSFNKSTGVADAVLNADPDVFFASVITPPLAGEVVFTSDPMIRYDRVTARWFLVIMDVVLNSGTGAITRPNRVLIAVSDATSNGVLSGSTVWTFYQFQGDAAVTYNFNGTTTLNGGDAGIDITNDCNGTFTFSLSRLIWIDKI